MKKSKQDIIEFTGRAIFIVLVFLFISVYYHKTTHQDVNIDQLEIVSSFKTNNTDAALFNLPQIPNCQKELITITDRLQLLFTDINRNLLTDNYKTTQRFIQLHKRLLIIKPLTFNLYYYQLFPKNSEEFPILS